MAKVGTFVSMGTLDPMGPLSPMGTLDPIGTLQDPMSLPRALIVHRAEFQRLKEIVLVFRKMNMYFISIREDQVFTKMEKARLLENRE